MINESFKERNKKLIEKYKILNKKIDFDKFILEFLKKYDQFTIDLLENYLIKFKEYKNQILMISHKNDLVNFYDEIIFFINDLIMDKIISNI